MSQSSIRRRLVVWVLGALLAGAVALMGTAYVLTLDEIDEVLDDGLRNTALLIADRGLASAVPSAPASAPLPFDSTDSMLVAITRGPGGARLFSSQPGLDLDFDIAPGPSVQQAHQKQWHVYTVVQPDRIVQVAQPEEARREVAAESASQLLLPLLALIALIGALLVVALRKGLQPLESLNDALSKRSAKSMLPLTMHAMPAELVPLVQALNDLLHRLNASFEAQQNFVADAAHELRSPVTALQLQAQILARESGPAARAAATAELLAGISRARRLIEQLLCLSRAVAEGDRLEPRSGAVVELGEVARSVVALWINEADRRQIDLGADIDDVQILGDAAQLEILLSNLVENALRYARSGNVVDVCVGALDGRPVLRVLDSGPGIPEGERSRVFDRFYRSPQAEASEETGSGLGLAIVKVIAERHGATVTLHGRATGTGLEVRVSFPAQTPSR